MRGWRLGSRRRNLDSGTSRSGRGRRRTRVRDARVCRPRCHVWAAIVDRLPSRPVLKHGPRSLTCAQVVGPGFEALFHGAVKARGAVSLFRSPRDPCRAGVKARGAGRSADPRQPLDLPAARSWSVHVGTRKMVIYARAGRSQRKLWWKPAAILTCKSIVGPWHRGERLIEPSSSWFPPKFP